MAHRVVAEVYAQDAMKSTNREYIIYQYTPSEWGWLHMTSEFYKEVKQYWPVAMRFIEGKWEKI